MRGFLGPKGAGSMRIRLRLAAILRKHLPPGETGSVVELDVEEGTTPLQVLESMNIPFERPLMIAVNQVKLRLDEVNSRALRDGETMAVFPAVGGG